MLKTHTHTHNTEMALNHNVTLLDGTVVMYVVFQYFFLASFLTSYIRVWISSQNAAAVTAKGLKIVHAPSDYFYLVIIDLLFESSFYLIILDIFRIVVRVSGLAISPRGQHNIISVS